METAKELLAQRDAIDEKLGTLQLALHGQNADMQTPLVDANGYPDPDLDIPAIVKVRHDINCLMNDRKEVTEKLEQALAELHSQKHDDIMEDAPKDIVHRTSNLPFLRVETVTYGSPAYEAGLAEEDEIVQCGSLHHDNFEGLKQLSDMLQDRIDSNINITVLRGIKVCRLVAQPRAWSGIGIFGARMTVIKK